MEWNELKTLLDAGETEKVAEAMATLNDADRRRHFRPLQDYFEKWRAAARSDD